MTARAQSHDTITRSSGVAADSVEDLRWNWSSVVSDTLVLHFDFDRYTLRRNDVARLDSFFNGPSFYSGIPSYLDISGYTDTVGTKTYNRRLALRRAEATLAYIKKFKVYIWLLPTTQITQNGEESPISGEDSLNRRVVVIYRYGPTTTFAYSTKCFVHATRLKKVVAADMEPEVDSASAPAPPAPAPNASQPVTTAPPAPEPDTVITLADINFIEDSPNLTEASRMIIPEYVRMLQRYKADSLEIDGYCHSQTPITNTSDPLFKLSVKRAKLIYDYLVDEGFDRAKLSFKGMGNATPKNEHAVTAEEARVNMRVEIRVFLRSH